MPLTEQRNPGENADRQAGAPITRDDAIMELARRLYENMEVEDPYEDKRWEALAQSERDFLFERHSVRVELERNHPSGSRHASTDQRRSNKPEHPQPRIGE
jgi:hypothetical protein